MSPPEGEMVGDPLAAFKKQVSPLIGIDLDAYKDSQMERRIRALMSRAGVADPDAYLKLLRNNPGRLEEFIDGLTINVSEWFRNPEQFHALEHAILPDLLERFPVLKIWSAGCSVGCEIYSVVILADRLGALSRCDFLGTDVDERALHRAAGAVFGPHDQQGLTPELIADYFTVGKDDTLRFRRDLAERVQFEKLNLLSDPSPTQCHLTICRNVVIYFTEASKAIIHGSLCNSLVRGGILFVGSTERIFHHRKLGLEQVRSFFYQKAA